MANATENGEGRQRPIEEDDEDANSASSNPIAAPTRRPLDTALRQQRMKAWQPILDPFWVIVPLVIVGACFIATGGSARFVIVFLTEMPRVEAAGVGCITQAG